MAKTKAGHITQEFYNTIRNNGCFYDVSYSVPVSGNRPLAVKIGVIDDMYAHKRIVRENSQTACMNEVLKEVLTLQKIFDKKCIYFYTAWWRSKKVDEIHLIVGFVLCD